MSVSAGREFRLLFIQEDGIHFLNGYIKKGQKPPQYEIDKAKKDKSSIFTCFKVNNMKFIYLKNRDIDEQLVQAAAEYFTRIHGMSVEIHACKNSMELTTLDLKKNPADVVVTFNLAGFDISTLTDGLSYNLVNSKFVHFLLEKHLPNERYLAKQLSISMFFYCVGESYYEYLLKNYPEIPYLKVLERWEAGSNQEADVNVKCIVTAIEEVIRECRL